MKTIKQIAQWDIDGTFYQIDKITEEKQVHIVLRDLKKHPYGVVSVIHFPNVAEFDDLPMMNWENFFRCSNKYGLPPEETSNGNLGYMATAVQNDLKPAATIRCETNSPIVQNLKKTLPESCMVVPYEEEDTTYICHRFRLSYLYAFAEIKRRYDVFNISDIDWPLVKQYMDKELLFFADNSKSGLSIESGAQNDTEKVIIGLILGYPIESTVSLINRTYRVFRNLCKAKAVEHFKTINEPFADAYRNKWNKKGDAIFIEGQQEDLYY